MSIEEMNEVGRKDIPYETRLRNAILLRDLKDSAALADKAYSLEVFNNNNIFIKANRIGITLYHPNKENPTHLRTEIYDISMTASEFGRQMARVGREFQRKIEGT